jgi:Dolichyl-phosphate-mannose-protein mannosyltransferase
LTPRSAKAATARQSLAVLFVLALAAAIQVAVIAGNRVHWDSDQAVVGIMARDILERGAHPVFFYGNAYAGTIDVYWLALVFEVLGESVDSYRFATVVLLGVLIYTVYRTTRTRFPRAAALLAVGYLATPPWFFLYKGLTAGVYDVLAILGGACIYCAFRLEEASRRGDRVLLWTGALGLAAGAGWWVYPLIVYFFLAIGLWFVIVRPSIFGRPISYLVFALAFLLGGLPWWLSNLRYHWKSLNAFQMQSAGLPQFGSQLSTVATQAIPILLGSRPVLDQIEAYPGELAVSLVLAFVPVVVAACEVWRLRRAIRDAPVGEDTTRTRGLLLLLLTLALGCVVVSTNRFAYLTEPRFLFPLYAVFPIVFGFAVWRLFTASRLGRGVAVGLLGLALFSSARGLFLPNLYGKYLGRTNDGPLPDLIKELERRRLHSGYASYWVAYRLSFESGERIVATPFGDWRLVRVGRFRDRVDKDPRPAFILYGEEAGELERYLKRRGEAFRQFSLGPFRVFHDITSASLEPLRRLGDIPPSEGKDDAPGPVTRTSLSHRPSSRFVSSEAFDRRPRPHEVEKMHHRT